MQTEKSPGSSAYNDLSALVAYADEDDTGDQVLWQDCNYDTAAPVAFMSPNALSPLTLSYAAADLADGVVGENHRVRQRNSADQPKRPVPPKFVPKIFKPSAARAGGTSYVFGSTKPVEDYPVGMPVWGPTVPLPERRAMLPTPSIPELSPHAVQTLFGKDAHARLLVNRNTFRLSPSHAIKIEEFETCIPDTTSCYDAPDCQPSPSILMLVNRELRMRTLAKDVVDNVLHLLSRHKRATAQGHNSNAQLPAASTATSAGRAATSARVRGQTHLVLNDMDVNSTCTFIKDNDGFYHTTVPSAQPIPTAVDDDEVLEYVDEDEEEPILDYEFEDDEDIALDSAFANSVHGTEIHASADNRYIDGMAANEHLAYVRQAPLWKFWAKTKPILLFWCNNLGGMDPSAMVPGAAEQKLVRDFKLLFLDVDIVIVCAELAPISQRVRKNLFSGTGFTEPQTGPSGYMGQLIDTCLKRMDAMRRVRNSLRTNKAIMALFNKHLNFKVDSAPLRDAFYNSVYAEADFLSPKNHQALHMMFMKVSAYDTFYGSGRIMPDWKCMQCDSRGHPCNDCNLRNLEGFLRPPPARQPTTRMRAPGPSNTGPSNTTQGRASNRGRA
ncbi:hypothetical protein AURDEDRAFT_125190 [Auricularia subglabra TFB-10046 SS5]|uniref:Uncharacterized protein n=1 Tax=Auricularia subglabra (strain TFB-10046 / SS5) TaxID=717982 RepID=J0WZB6_AURST|nr:hypothetical protein AURDEDRAFT_125190 [Auricularia subglabra TFB-10046 SS5]